MRKNNRTKGFTLLELTIAMAVTTILLLGAINLSTYVATANARATVRQELFHHATISMEFLTTHISEAQSIDLQTENNGTLQRIDMFINRNTPQAHQRVINFRPVTPPNNRLMFGGQGVGLGTQEVARYIADVEIIHDTNTQLLHITVTTEASIGRFAVEVEPVVLYRAIDVRYKTVLN
ncbi:MAG: prepilin-type N-terminal cleavage/methylation domain-containing protein [Defluviitaleaceae bacterium]|nr:prepilin-type N-terminal cleavage/methylation domain-containing protein [Defluviitaleaceae bacterium]